MARGGKGQKTGKRGNAEKANPPASAATPAELPPVDVDALWIRMRQGAANVAGVSFQIAVTTLLLVDGIGGQAIAAIKPEGLEDIDCTLADGSHVLVQVKERAAGKATLGVAEIGAAIDHAADALETNHEAQFVIVTDAELPDSVDPGEPVTDLGGLEQTDHGLRARTSVLRIGWNEVSAMAVAAIEDRHGVGGAVATIAHDRLVCDLARAAAEQRARSSATAVRRGPADVESIVQAAASTVDLDALTEAERAGVISLVDFTRPLTGEGERFLRGVDVSPGHVAAGLDFLRVEELKQIFDALQEDRFSVVSGPSGAGKSALLWRAAFELGGRFKLARLRGVASDQVELVARFARLQSPSPERPLLICADNIGRPDFGAWSDGADALLEIPNVYVIASVRNEDLTTALLRGRARPVEPRLDAKLAREIEAQAIERGIETRLEFEEALGRADGLLMEFVSLLISGERLEDVIAGQVEARLAAGRTTEREVLRFVTGAHSAGLALAGTSLASLVENDRDLPGALDTLRNEFLVAEPQRGVWTGLHELRSEQVSAVLHETPPPTRAETVARLTGALASAAECELLLLHAVRSEVDVTPCTDAARERLAAADAREAAELLQVLLRVDGFDHARACLKATQARLPEADDRITLMAYTERFYDFESKIKPIEELARKLPEPSQALAKTASASLTSPHVAELLARAGPSERTELCEVLVASEWPGEIDTGLAEQMWATGQDGDFAVRARLMAALSRLVTAGPSQFAPLLEERMSDLSANCRDVLRWRFEGDDDLEIDIFDSGAEKSRLVEIARLAYDLCPEIVLVRLQLIGSNGNPSARIDSLLEAPREHLPNPAIDNRHVLVFRDGLDRALAADNWSERLRRQERLVADLQSLLERASQRVLDRNDNSRRRREWRELAAATGTRAMQMPSPPLPRGPDDKQAPDPAKVALKRVSAAIEQLANELEDLKPHRCLGIASQLLDALAKLDEPSVLGEVEQWPISRRLTEDVGGLRGRIEALADLLLARGERTEAIVKRKNGESWDEAAEGFVDATRDAVIRREREILELALAAVPHELQRIPSAGDGPRRLVGDSWLAVVTPDNWGELVAGALFGLDDEDRALFAHRLRAMPQVEGVLVPVQGILLGHRHQFPLTQEQGEAAATAAARPYIAGPTLAGVMRAVEAYVEADRAAAHARLRREELESQTETERARALLALANEAAAALKLPEETEKGFQYLAGLVETQITEKPRVGIASGEDRLAATGQPNLDAMLVDVLISSAIGLAAQRGEVSRP